MVSSVILIAIVRRAWCAGSSSLDWSRSVWPANFSYVGGRTVQPSRRERPHVVVGKDGVVTALTTAVQLGAADMTQTLVQEVRQTGSVVGL